MAKGFTTVRLIKGKEPVLRQLICEVRFRDGHLYLDHCGRLLKKLVSAQDWVIATLPTAAGMAVFNLAEGIALNLSMYGASLDLNRTATDEFIDPAETKQFAQIADDALGLVFDELEVKDWSRIGCRELYYFPCNSQTETENWLRELGIFSVSATLADSFKSQLSTIGVSMVMDCEEYSYRISLNSAERPAQVPIGNTTLNVRSSKLPKKQDEALKKVLKKERQRQINAAFAAVLDIDAYREDPADLDVAEFIQECAANNLERFFKAIPVANGKKGK